MLFTCSLVLHRISIPNNAFAGTAWVDQGATKITVALTLGPHSGIAFLWFIGVVRDRLGDFEDRFFASVFFGSGLLFLAMVFVSLATIWLRTGVMPRWLVVITYLLALTLLVVVSLSLWVTLVFPAWVLLISVFILVTVRHEAIRQR